MFLIEATCNCTKQIAFLFLKLCNLSSRLPFQMFQMLCHDCFLLWTSRNLLLEANFRLCSAFLSLAMRSTSKHDSFYPKASLFPFPSWWGPKYQFPETFYLFLQMKLSKYSKEFVRNSSLNQRSILTNVTYWLCVFSWLGHVALFCSWFLMYSGHPLWYHLCFSPSNLMKIHSKI